MFTLTRSTETPLLERQPSILILGRGQVSVTTTRSSSRTFFLRKIWNFFTFFFLSPSIHWDELFSYNQTTNLCIYLFIYLLYFRDGGKKRGRKIFWQLIKRQMNLEFWLYLCQIDSTRSLWKSFEDILEMEKKGERKSVISVFFGTEEIDIYT